MTFAMRPVRLTMNGAPRLYREQRRGENDTRKPGPLGRAKARPGPGPGVRSSAVRSGIRLASPRAHCRCPSDWQNCWSEAAALVPHLDLPQLGSRVTALLRPDILPSIGSCRLIKFPKGPRPRPPLLSQAAARHAICVALIIAMTQVASLQSQAAAADPGSKGSAGKVDFDREVQPVLAKRCFRCHGPDKAEAGLRLDLGSGPSPGSNRVRTLWSPATSPKVNCSNGSARAIPPNACHPRGSP